MSNQPEALRLAEWIESDMSCDGDEKIAAELRRLHAELERCRQVCAATAEGWRTDAEELEALRDRLSALLSATAIALRGPEPELTSWSWHDLPERAAALLEALKEIVDAADGTGWDQLDASFSRARAAIKAAEGGQDD